MADAHQELLDSLRAATGLLELDRASQLQRDVTAVCSQVGRRDVRIAVFAPFNYGKSTLLNAILGQRALPIDLIPTTGAAITVRYGDDLRTRIQLANGTEIREAGTEVLKRFAILDDDRQMRRDVTAVEVLCPHPWLKTGVELVDLPGTDDREAQDALVKDQLLTADLVVQVLDARKLMTLGEREHLRDWLLDRGIETVVFVVNFLNLLEPDDQKQVYNRLRFVAESFRSQLPSGVSNLFRVDALPALRARLKGDAAAAQTSGLPAFETALHTIAQAQQAQTEARIPRVQAIGRQVLDLLQGKITEFEQAASDGNQTQKIAIKRQASQLIQKGFAKSAAEFSTWLSLSHLLDRYQRAAAIALSQNQFTTWERDDFKKTAIDHQQAVAKWVHQACEFFDRPRPHQLLVSFPPEPSIGPEAANRSPTPKSSSVAPAAIATGLGWVLGGPVGGAILGGASYLLNKTINDPTSNDPPAAPIAVEMTYAHLEAAREYLINFSSINLAALQRYETIGDRLIQFDETQETLQMTHQHYQLQLLQGTLERLQTAIAASLSHPPR